MDHPYAGKPAPPPELKAMSDKKPEVPMVEVTLTRPHTHAGVGCGRLYLILHVVNESS